MTENNKMNYTNGKVYKVTGMDPNDLYCVGTTTKKYLSQRMTKLRADYIAWKDSKHSHQKVYDIFDKYGVDNCRIILLETCSVSSKDELRSRGQSFKDLLALLPSKENAIRDEGEVHKKLQRRNYYQNHKDESLERTKQWYEENKERVNNKKNEDVHCDICNCDMTRSSMGRHLKSTKHLRSSTENL
jgi:hypothetical protein